MSHAAHRNSGAPTFIATSASLSLSGLDQLDAAMDPTLIDMPAWYPNSSEPHALPIPPQQEDFGMNFGHGFASHRGPVSHDALHQPQYHPVASMNGIHHQYDPVRPRLEDISPTSPLQGTFPQPYTTPYPDSTASSVPSEDALLPDVDEDKRKRNQAASARFRQKKKQREQQMLEQSRAMQERTRKLESTVENLKMENMFLKKLLVEKVDNLSEDEKAMLVKTTSSQKCNGN